jgi:hypothetical protein
MNRFSFSLLIFAAAAAAGCGANQKIIDSAANSNSSNSGSVAASNGASASGTPSPAEAERPPGVEGDVAQMKTADFNYIIVLRRKDGREIDNDDRKFLNENTPADTNRRLLSRDKKAVTMASNFKTLIDARPTFESRFTIEDHSKPASEIKPPGPVQ